MQLGLIRHEPGASTGYTLFGGQTGATWLIDMGGMVVHRWDYPKAKVWHLPELLPDGHLMATVSGRRVAWLRPDGGLAWQYRAPDQIHHDHALLPSGNVLLLLEGVKTREEVIAAGGDPAVVPPGGLKVDHLIEVRPTPPEGGEIVWRWSVWDHLVQDFDPAKPHYGSPALNPGRVDLNFLLQALSTTRRAEPGSWLHANAIDHHAEADQVLIVARNMSELWVVDHSTTLEQAAGSQGGAHGRGGDLLYRWGNPRAHGAGTAAEQRLFWPHAAHWIPAGLPGAGNILLFNNGDEFEGARRDHSEVLELHYPLADARFGAWPPGAPQPPAGPVWRFAAAPPERFLSYRTSNAQRLANGNTLITSGLQATIFEVTPQGAEVWRYVSPIVDGQQWFQGDPVPLVELDYVEGLTVGNSLYRALRYAPDHPGLSRLDLTPKGTVERYRPGR